MLTVGLRVLSVSPKMHPFTSLTLLYKCRKEMQLSMFKVGQDNSQILLGEILLEVIILQGIIAVKEINANGFKWTHSSP